MTTKSSEELHYSVRDSQGNRHSCYLYEGMAKGVALRENRTRKDDQRLHVEPVTYSQCPHMGHKS